MFHWTLTQEATTHSSPFTRLVCVVLILFVSMTFNLVRIVAQETITVANAASLVPYKTISAKSNFLAAVPSPDGKLIASGHPDGTISLWDLETAKKVKHFDYHKEDILSLAFSPDGKLLASSASGDGLRLVNIESEKEIASLIGHEGDVHDVVFSPDGKTLASSGEDKSIRLWTATGKAISTLQGDDAIRSIAFSPDGKEIAASDVAGALHLWDVTTGKEVVTLDTSANYLTSFTVFNVDGSRLAAVGDEGIQIWNTKKTSSTLWTKSDSGLVMNSVAFSPDGTLVVSAHGDGTLGLWDAETGAELATLKGHDGSITAIWFNALGTELFSAGRDNLIQIWAITSEPSMRRALSETTLRGKIQAAGEPMSNEHFSVVIQPKGMPGVEFRLDAKTNNEGEYALTNLVPGDAKIDSIAISFMKKGNYRECTFSDFSGMSLTGTNNLGEEFIIMILSSTNTIKLETGKTTIQDLIVKCN